jgi:dipeptidyl-peptidase-4
VKTSFRFVAAAFLSTANACAPRPAESAPAGAVERAPTQMNTPAPAWPALDQRYLEASAATQGFRLGRPVPLAITPDGAVLFRRTKPRDRRADLYELSPTGRSTLVASVDALLAGADDRISDEEKARRERTRTATAGIVDIDVSRDGRVVLVPIGGRLFLLERATHALRELAAGPGTPFDPHLSPDGRYVAFARDGDVWVVGADGGAPRRLTHHDDGIELGLAEFVAQEEFDRTRGFWWSPDGKFVLFQRTDARKVETAYVADPRHPEKVPVPFKYPRPGQDNALVDLGIVPVSGGKPIWVRWDTAAMPYLAQVTWKPGAPLALVVLDRNQTEETLLRVDPATGKTLSLLVERDEAWIEPSPGSPVWFEDGSGFLWAELGERGYSLERYDANGKHVATVLSDAFGLRRICGIEPGGSSVIVQAAADPRVEHVFRVPLDGKPPLALTSGRGVHRADADHGVTVLTSSVDASGATVTAVSPSGVRTPLPSEAEKPPSEPTTVLESVELPGRTLYTAITRPHAFDPQRRYPVLVRVYGGPGVKMVVDARATYLLDQWYADAGFIVVRADGRGSPDRGRAFERALLRDLVTVPLEDQVAALAAMQARHPEMDPARTGIFGWSFGGYLSTMAVLLRPDVFAAAVAGAPPTDWALYDTAYTERYLKLPADDPAGYERSSVLTYAERLSRPLLVIHGVTDDNVHFAHTLALFDALYTAGKRAELVTLPSTHMVPEPKLAYLREKTQVDFFREHLGRYPVTD